uniref:Retroviral polymerase SH3-like domain-containing protein n=1 Tax=Strigamia maritima TaxID=126957 RepID=T1IGZ6_STRMM
MYVRGLKQLGNNDDVKEIEFSSPVKDITCDVCNISKSTRASYKSSGKSVMDFPLDLIHMDLCGPAKKPSIGGAFRIDGKIPYVLFRKRPLNVGHMRIPGTLAYAHIQTEKRKSKHHPRAWKGIMVGYAMRIRGYRIWDPSTDKVHKTKHVKIVESKRWINFDDERDDDENEKNPILISNDDSSFDDDVFEAEAQSDEDQNDEDLDVFGTPMKPGRRSEIEIEARNANRLVKIDSPYL